jgi:hypothetical protein
MRNISVDECCILCVVQTGRNRVTLGIASEEKFGLELR